MNKANARNVLIFQWLHTHTHTHTQHTHIYIYIYIYIYMNVFRLNGSSGHFWLKNVSTKLYFIDLKEHLKKKSSELQNSL